MGTGDGGGKPRAEAQRALLERLGLAPEMPHLAEALTHPSFANEQHGADVRDNQRLEFLGDAVLGLCITEEVMAAFDDVDEGQLSFMRAALVNAFALAQRAREIGLDGAVLLGRGAARSGDRHRDNVLADALEALVACVFLDCGLDGARALVRSVFAGEIGRLVAFGGVERDAKSRLQELVQQRGLPPPRYIVVEELGPVHAREFDVEVSASVAAPLASELCREEPRSNDEPRRYAIVTRGRGCSKQLAEQAAARHALEAFAACMPETET
ncbi:MAG: ribonuclease III [Myxococcales bacterium]|nr:ribonuclease III [Myxococcales bacterium]